MRSLRGKNARGFAVLAIAVALSILAVFALSVAYLGASNERGVMSTQYKTQGYYISHAALEYTLRNMRALHNCSPGDRMFLNTDLGISVAGKIYSATSYGSGGMLAGNSFSVTAPTGGSPGPCIYALSTTGSGALALNGGANFNSVCVVNVNSSSSTALTLSNNSTMNVSTLNIVGSYSAQAGSITGRINTGVASVGDPFAAIPMITYGNTCDHTSFTVSGTATLNPGVYCGGIAVSGNGVVTLNPGNYIVDGGTVNITGSGTLQGTGVTFFLNSKIQATYPTFSVGGNVTFNLTAPTTGVYKGIAIYQSRSAPSATDTVIGKSGANITGAIYFPNQTLNFSGSTSSSAPCTLPIANIINISGSTNITCAVGDLGGLITASC